MIQIIAIATGVLFASIFLYFAFIFVQQKLILRNFRGPLAFPLIGNCYSPQAVVFLKYLGTLRKLYGKIYTFFSFAKGFLVVCDPIVVRRVLSDVKTFPKGADYTNKFNFIFGEGLVTSNGEKYKKDRSAFGKYFIRTNLSKYCASMNTITKDAFQQYLTIPKGQKFLSLNIEEVFAKLAFRTFMKFSINADLRDRPELEDKLCHLTSTGSNAVGRIILFNLPLWNIFPEIQALNQLKAAVYPLCRELIANRKQLITEGKDDDLDDCLTAMIREQLPEQEMFDHLVTLLAAGHDTTAFFISYMVYLLANHPEEQVKVYNEIVEKLGNKEMIASDDFGELKYLQCVMMETLRLFAVIPLLTREVAEEITIAEAGITLPKGATVMLPLTILNRDPEIWENPSDFLPSRFIEKGNDFTNPKGGYFPFGYGTR